MKAEELRDILDGCEGMEVVFSVPRPVGNKRGHRDTNRPVHFVSTLRPEGGAMKDETTFVPTEYLDENDPDTKITHLCVFLTPDPAEED